METQGGMMEGIKFVDKDLKKVRRYLYCSDCDIEMDFDRLQKRHSSIAVFKCGKCGREYEDIDYYPRDVWVEK
jgi:transcription elongation factor Elf1